MPFRPLAPLPDPKDHGGVTLLYRRRYGRLDLRLEKCRDGVGHAAPLRKLPRRLRKLSARGIIDGRYGWPRSEHVPSFADWTIYGRPSDHRDARSDIFIFTQDFVAHGQQGLPGATILPKIRNTRYGTPLYQLDGEASVLPVYLRSRLAPPRSAHERIEHFNRCGAQLCMILDTLGLSVPTEPVLTWLQPENYA
jgi:hypothetical protein